MEAYYPQRIEKKWQNLWQSMGLYSAKDFSRKPKKYILIEFPYPSGDGLHVGHVRSYVALDVISRYYRMKGFNVLYPIGWDAFGLPTENYAIRTGIHPEIATKKNIANFTRQLKSVGLSFDWSREINTTDPSYYKWTQWIFLQLFKHGLAYRAEMPINWCPFCKIGLANEEVINGNCERCGARTSQRKIKQWMLKITAYADRLLKDLADVDYPEHVKVQQQNWIGRSEGTIVKFKINPTGSKQQNAKCKMTSQNAKPKEIEVFTTRVDTIFGVTAIVLAPEHKLLREIVQEEHKNEVERYIRQSQQKSEFERTQLEKEKTGVFTGSYCINPVNGEKVPIWVGDYVVAAYGGGAVMVVPAHDKRDYEFAKKYGLEVREVVSGGDVSKEAFVDYGTLVNSGQFSGLNSKEAIARITEWLAKNKLGKKTVQYKLRDWVFSRQHYWGEPIPLVFCENCKKQAENPKYKTQNQNFNDGELLNPGWIALPEKDLPVKLPYVKKYKPTGTGESPLAAVKKWVNTKCPKCKGPARRETDTMPNWAGSSWYFMRYTDPKNNKKLADPKKLKYWLPVDWYNGGMEHTTLHLLYSRFWYKFLYDIGVAPTKEPYKKRTSHGIVLAEDGRKMSKSFGNVINPDDIVKQYGADTLRLYEMFMGPFDQAISWSSAGVRGVRRFLDKVWRLCLECAENEKSGKAAQRQVHKLNKKVNEDIEQMKFNTIIAAFMEFVNFAQDNKKEVGRDVLQRFLVLLAPFAPHITEELFQKHFIHNSKFIIRNSVHIQPWPEYDSKLIQAETYNLIIQINGRVRDKVEVPVGISEEEATKIALSRDAVKKWTAGKQIQKAVFVQGRLINFVF